MNINVTTFVQFVPIFGLLAVTVIAVWLVRRSKK
jgi:hypothetical protein